jgi:hypothetical protein
VLESSASHLDTSNAFGVNVSVFEPGDAEAQSVPDASHVTLKPLFFRFVVIVPLSGAPTHESQILPIAPLIPSDACVMPNGLFSQVPALHLPPHDESIETLIESVPHATLKLFGPSSQELPF